MQDIDFMRRALTLAQKGVGWVSPNPLVGAVLVKEGRILAEGYHARCGEPHAERIALAAAKESPAGATLYVTLEPCCHQGRTAPCTEAILKAGIERVVIGSRDPNPRVNGGGLAILRAAGVRVDLGVLREDCDACNEVFFHYIQSKTPFVVMKYAMTMDGKIATVTGASQWITGEAARARVHADRKRYRGILLGVGTVLADNPRLTCRLPEGRNPLRIVCDSHLRTPLDSALVQSAQEVETLLVTCCTAPEALAPYLTAGCEILSLPPAPDGKLDLHALMQALGEREVDGLLLEGGSTLNWSMLSLGLVQRLQCYLAPKLFGGAGASSPIGGAGVLEPAAAFRLSPPRISAVGEDLLLESEVLPCLPASLRKSAR